MEINELLKGMNCHCGRQHTCRIQSVFIEEQATKHLPSLCAAYHGILLVADENTYEAAGGSVEHSLYGKIAKRLIFPGKPLLIPDETAVLTVQDAISSGIDLLIGIGSGVIQDLCKFCADRAGLRYIIVATAPSMDGYASTGAAMITGGMKVTYQATVPLAILADPTILAAAPFEMIQAGYGDIIGKFSSLNDWKLSAVINHEYFCATLYDMTLAVTNGVLSLASGIHDRDPSAIRSLMEALVLVGIFMSFAGSSRPASGSEHHISHFFEITGILFNQPYFPHGIDVAYSTVVTARIREKLLNTSLDRPVFRLDKPSYEAKLSHIFGPIAADCGALQNECNAYTTDRRYKENEAVIKGVLALCPSSAAIKEMLYLVGLDWTEFEPFYGKERIRSAVAYAKELKDRYTVLGLYYDMFGEEPVI